MKFFLSFLISFTLIFTNTVYASDFETHEGSSFDDENSNSHSRGGSFSLGDVVHDRHGTGSRGGGFQEFVGYEGDDFNAQNFVRQPILTALSSFAVLTPEVVDDAVASLLLNDDFLDSIIFDPYNKVMSWNADTARHGGGALEHLLNVEYTDNIPYGFYACDYTNYFRISSASSERRGYLYCADCFFSNVNGTIVFCSLSTSSVSVKIASASGIPTSNTWGTTNGWRKLYDVYKTSSASYYYDSYPFSGMFAYNGDFNQKYPVVYSSVSDAVSAFYGFTPTTETRPNGKGYVSLFSGNQIATSKNVYNRDWTSVITTNFNDYGSTFNSSVVNNYYYTAPSNTAPSYWYDVYDNDPVSVPSHDYDDLTDITLSNPDIQVNHNFITDVFGSFPVVLTTLFLSLLVLAAVLIFLRG